MKGCGSGWGQSKPDTALQLQGLQCAQWKVEPGKERGRERGRKGGRKGGRGGRRVGGLKPEVRSRQDDSDQFSQEGCHGLDLWLWFV